jgi:hypothetical protein
MSHLLDINNVPMRGKGLYSTNSGLQWAAMQTALPLISKRPDKFQCESEAPFVAVDYGNNS